MFGKNKMNSGRRNQKPLTQSNPAQQPPASPNQALPEQTPPTQSAGKDWFQTISENKKGLALVGVIIVSALLVAFGGQLYGADQQTMVMFALGLLIDVALVGVVVGASLGGALKWLTPVFIAVVLLVVIGMSPKEIVEVAKEKGLAVTGLVSGSEWQIVRDFVVWIEPGQKIATGMTVEEGDRINFVFSDKSCPFKFRRSSGEFELVSPSAVKREHTMVISTFGQFYIYGADQSGVIRVIVCRK